MDKDRHIRRKYTFRAYGEKVIFVKRKNERTAHVWMKAFLWALYLKEYPDLSVEVKIDDRYKPDVVSPGEFHREPRFWGEAGAVSTDKLEYLLQRYTRTHFSIGKWNASLGRLMDVVRDVSDIECRHAPIDLLSFPPDSANRFITDHGDIMVSFEDVDFVRLGSFATRG